MMQRIRQSIRAVVLTSLFAALGLTFTHCSGEKKETTNGASTADSSVFGRQGDTLNSSSMDAPQQAPPDSADARGAVVPAEIKVRAKQQ